MGFGRSIDDGTGVTPARHRALVMGVLNVTPDSFSDGGLFTSEDSALERAERMFEEGADLVDVGAESTRPGSTPVDAAEQIRRIGQVIAKITRMGRVSSVDTTSARVAAWALDQGATYVNSASLDFAEGLGELCARSRASLVLMHARGSMGSMSGFSAGGDDAYGDVVSEVAREWLAAAELALSKGLPREALLLDPGLGFHKNAFQSLALCARLHELAALGFPVVVGASRKSFVARVLVEKGAPIAPPEDRLGASVAAAIACVSRGAHMVRVHDVAPTVQALRFTELVELSKSAVPANRADSVATDPHVPPSPADRVRGLS